ncbi:hypothetical protein AB9P05_18600 [Roseivirga sp. BDSF3-8]|uniref:hypothetical protein n=1 Tax=Roseivirga sp. BDSF3-8 TaxID=3241598 RepID=UPI00353188A3
MGYLKYIRRLQRIDRMIRKRRTGTPGELAIKLGISERMTYEIIKELREDLEAPISYCNFARSYYYTQEYSMKF